MELALFMKASRNVVCFTNLFLVNQKSALVILNLIEEADPAGRGDIKYPREN